MTAEVDSHLNFRHDERRKFPSAEREKEKKENFPGGIKSGIATGNLRRRIEKGVMSSCGGVITFHVDDCNSDKSERMSLEKPAQCVTKRGRPSYERVHGGYRKR